MHGHIDYCTRQMCIAGHYIKMDGALRLQVSIKAHCHRSRTICLLQAFCCNDSSVSRAATSEMVRRREQSKHIQFCHSHLATLKKLSQGAAVNILLLSTPETRSQKRDSSYQSLSQRKPVWIHSASWIQWRGGKIHPHYSKGRRVYWRLNSLSLCWWCATCNLYVCEQDEQAVCVPF